MLPLLLACASGTVAVDDTAQGSSAADSAADTGDTGDSDTEVIPEGDCDPGAAPVYVTEGEAVSVRVSCRGEGAATAFAIDVLPEGARFDAGSATLTWTPGLDQAGHYELVVASAGDMPDAGVLDIWVADAWADVSNTPVNPLRYEEEHGLPVFHLEVPSTTNDDEDVETTLVYRARPYALGLKYRGASSSYYPKRSYTLSFPRDDEFGDAAEDFDERRKVVLTTLFDDNSYMRQLLCYELWSALDPGRHDIQTYLAVVYVNGSYEGLYLVSDHISGEYWEDHGYDEDGNLYKSVSHQANFYATYNGAPKSTWHDGYDKKEGVDGDWSDLDALVQFVAESDDATFAAGVEERVVLDEIADWWILVRYTEADDSGGKNAYHYADAATGLFHHAPWDFNHSFGQTWRTEREPASTDYDFHGTNNLFRRLLTHAEYGPYIEGRLREHLAGPLATEAVLARIDAHLDRIAPSAARDWEKWDDPYYTYGGWYWRTDWTDHHGEVAYLRAWVEARGGFFAEWYP